MFCACYPSKVAVLHAQEFAWHANKVPFAVFIFVGNRPLVLPKLFKTDFAHLCDLNVKGFSGTLRTSSL